MEALWWITHTFIHTLYIIYIASIISCHDFSKNKLQSQTYDFSVCCHHWPTYLNSHVTFIPFQTMIQTLKEMLITNKLFVTLPKNNRIDAHIQCTWVGGISRIICFGISWLWTAKFNKYIYKNVVKFYVSIL